MDNKRSTSDSPVLYELLVYKDWKLDPEQWKSVTQYSLLGEDGPPSWWWKLLGLHKLLNQHPWPEEDLAKAAAFLLPWQISLSPDGKRVAVLQDSVLEIRASRDEYTTVIGRATIPRDKRPQFRKMAWSPDSHSIAVASSDGSVRVYDYTGSLIFKIPLIPPEVNPKKLITGLEFVRSREKKNEWELLIIFANGSLDCYIISSIDKCMFSHHSVLSPSGISCTAFCQEHGILFAAVKPLTVLSFEEPKVSYGLTAWRLLEKPPYYTKLFPTIDENSILRNHSKSLWWFFLFFTPQESITKIIVSPNSEYIATLHITGTVLIWLSPILRIYSKIEEIDTKNQKVMVMLSETSKSCHVVDIEWRKDNKLIVGWKNGTISIHDIHSSVILTYFGPEVLNGLPRLTSAPLSHGFLVLECETVHFVRPSVSPDMSSDEEKSILDTTSELIQSTMYLLTDLEQYEPKMKSVKVVQRIFRLLGVKMTTPEELFERYLQNNEFDKAFEICDEYGLDIMKVYQRQWRTSEVSDFTILEYLNNVKDEEWILNECLERIPESLSGARLMIDYSLTITNRKSYLDELKKTDKIKWKKFIIARLIFLDYEEKFLIYEQIFNESSYDMDHYKKFRKQNIVDSAVDFARSGNSLAVELLFTHNGKEVLPYWLNVLDNFPESISPLDYKSLLPECNADGDPVEWKCITNIETSDWAKEEYFSEFCELLAVPHKTFDTIYNFDPEGFSNWYKKRALTIEELCTVVDNAVILLELGIERNIKGLDETLYQLKMLSTLVYELNLNINFAYLKKQCNLQKLQLFIQKPEDFDSSMIRYVHPALEHFADTLSNSWFMLYRGVMLTNSQKNLGSVLKYLSHILHENMDIIGLPERFIHILIECIYAYEPLDLLVDSEKLIDDTGRWLAELPEGIISEKKPLFRSLLILKDEIKSAHILAKHCYGRSLSYLHDIRENYEKSRQFIVEFTKSVVQSLPVDIDEWKKFLSDLLYLQKNTFRCIPSSYWYEIYVSHMLKSSSMMLIENSSDILCCSRSEHKRHLDYKNSVRIIINASQYYFNCSSHYDDRFMQLAKTCLLLIKEDNEEIQEELDLIFAVKLLSETGLKVLPIQVRQTKDRLKLIDLCFDRNCFAYRNPQLMRRLAFKLHILHDNKRRCYNIVTLRLAQEAYKQHDYPACAEFCQELINERFSESWKLCMTLAECDEYKDVQMKLKLVTFCSIFSPSRVLPQLFRIRENLNSKLAILNLFDSLDECAENNILPHSSSYEWKNLKELNLFDDKEEVLKIITDIWFDLLIDRSALKIQPADLYFSFPNFYSLILPHTHKSYHESYFTSDIASKESKLFCILDLIIKVILIKSDLKDDIIIEVLQKALTISAIFTSKEDSALSMCYFLCLNNKKIAIKDFYLESHLVFELELYFIALKDLCFYSKNVFSLTPVEAISTFLESPFEEASIKYFRMVVANLKNHDQAKKVLSLECGIDSTRFKNDETYKKDTILGLAMNEEYDTLKLAIDLSKEENFDAHEVVITHLTFLLINSCSATVVQRISDDEILPIIIEYKDYCIERLVETLPHLSGTDYQILISFFSIIKTLKEDYCMWLLTPKEHISLLKKLKSLPKGVDYKDLVQCNDELHFVLQPLMISENVLVVGKFIKSLPSVIRNRYDIGMFFCQWAVQEFNKTCINVSFKQAVLNFENLGKFFAKLSKNELQIFIESTVLSLGSVAVMDSGLRKQLIISMMDWCNSNNSRGQYESFLSFLQKNLDILNQLWDEDYENWNQTLKNYVFLLEQSLRESSFEENAMDIFKRAILDPEVVKTDLNYLQKITQIKEPILSLMTKLLDCSNMDIMDKWKKQFSDEEEVSNDNTFFYYTAILEKYQYSSCHLDSDYWMETIFSAFKESFPHSFLRTNLNDIHSCLAFLPDLIQRISNFDQIVILHRFIEEIPESVEFDKHWFGIALLKVLVSIHSANKYDLALGILSSNDVQKEDFAYLLSCDFPSTDNLFLSWLSFHSKSSEVCAIGKSLFEKEENQQDEKFFQLPTFVIEKIIPFVLDTGFYERLIKSLSHDDEKKELLQIFSNPLLDKCMVVEATALSLSLHKTPKGLTSFDTALRYS